jgi:hypothetical protein
LLRSLEYCISRITSFIGKDSWKGAIAMKTLIQVALACVFFVQINSDCLAQSVVVKSRASLLAAHDSAGFPASGLFQYSNYGAAATSLASTAAGVNPTGSIGDGGPATAAQLNQPNGMALDSAGNLYIIDSENHRVRKVMPAGVISTVAGGGNAKPSDGGQATAAKT